MNVDPAEKVRRRLARRHGLAVPGSAPAPDSIAERRPANRISYPTGADNLLDAIANVVDRFPDNTAIRCGGRRMTYRELDTASSRLARALHARGADPRQPIGILLERSVELAVAVWAVLKTGSHYVPLDPSNPTARLAHILEDAAPSSVITSSAVAGVLPENTPVLLVDAPLPDGGSPRPEVGPGTPAYILFTSGTTGRPKGARVSHGNLLQLLASADPVWHFDSTDVWSLFHSFAFDFAVWELWGPLLHGGCVAVVPQDVARDPAEFWRFLRDERVTVVNHTPKAFNVLVDEDARHQDRLPLRRVLLGGEALRFADLARWVDKYGDSDPELYNIYGMTEATVLSSFRRVRAADLDEPTSVIGRPLPGLGFLLLDDDLTGVPAGAVGEIAITGGGVADCYVARPELTADRFVQVRTADGEPVRAYRTGDLGRLTPSGEYEFHGRTDDQVKIRGFRVELGEVENVLNGVEGVRRAAVVARDLPGLGRSLVAYVVAVPGADVSAVTLRRRLLRLLPDYMVPAAFVPMDRIPLNHNGKLNREELPAPVVEGEAVDVGGLDDVTARVTTIASALLHRAVAPEADFFELGGHSLLAARLLAQVRDATGVEVPLREFFREPTAHAVAGRVKRALTAGGGTASRVTAIGPAPAGEPVPATSSQQRLYFLDRLTPGEAAYHIHAAVLVEGPLEVDALRAALSGVLARHAPLRTVLRLEGGQVVQRIEPPAEVALRVDEGSVPDDETWDDHLLRLSATEESAPFDLEHDPMLRARLVRFGAHRHLLLLTMHHVAADGWSVAVLGRDLAVLYAHAKGGNDVSDAPLPRLTVTYADYAHHVHRWLGSAEAEDDIAYWTERLAGLPAVHGLPFDRPRPGRMAYRGRTVEFTVRGPAHRALLALCHAENVSVFMLLQAVYAVVIARRGHSDDVVFGSPVANRPTTDLDDLVGLFVNTLVLRVDVGSATTFRELLTMVRDRTLRDLEHQHVPFEVLVKRLNPERDTAHTPLFQLMLVVQNNEEPTLELDGVRVRRVGLTDHVARTDLVLDVVQRADELAFRWKYDTALFQDDTMISMAGEFEQLLFDVSTDPSALAAPLHAAGAPRRRAGTAVFPLRVHDGSAEPVFALPGILGFGASFAQLAAHLGERPCHAINTRDLVDAGGDGLTTDRLLRMCADEVESVAGGTPVHLVGHSVGAALAYLLVDVLRNRGRDVLSLVLLDPPSPTEMGGEPDRPEPIVEFFGTIAHLIPDDVRARGEHLLARRADLGDDGVLEAAEALLPAHASAVLDGGLHRAFRDYSRMNALVWPAPRTTPVPTLVVRATGGLGAAAPDLTAAWANHLAGYHVLKDVPDSHEGMLRGEGAQRLGPLLSGFLDDVTARRGAQW